MTTPPTNPAEAAAKEIIRPLSVWKDEEDFNKVSEWMAAIITRHFAALQAERDALRTMGEKVNAIRNSIIGMQGFNFSEHAYPLVAALNEAGFVGQDYPAAKANLGTLIEQRDKAEKERDELAKKQPINTHVRLFDLVRFMRAELHQADLITDEEYTWLAAEAPMATDPKGGSPSPRRLEDYDDLRSANAALEKERDLAKASCDHLWKIVSECMDELEMKDQAPSLMRGEIQEWKCQVGYLKEKEVKATDRAVLLRVEVDALRDQLAALTAAVEARDEPTDEERAADRAHFEKWYESRVNKNAVPAPFYVWHAACSYARRTPLTRPPETKG